METNPFTASLVIKASEVLNKNIGNVTTILIEKTTPASLFMNDELLKILCNFSPSGREMVFYILRYIGEKVETIEINYEKYCSRMGETSTRSFYRAIAELTNIIIVKKKRKNTYYVNPLYVFRGSRIKCYPDKTTIVQESTVVAQLRNMQLIKPRDTTSQLCEEVYDETDG